MTKKNRALSSMIFMSALLAHPLAQAGVEYTINNQSTITYQNVTIADPTVRPTSYQIVPGNNTVSLKEDNNVVIQLKTYTQDILSIIIQLGKAPTCYPKPSRCEFERNQPDQVTLVY